MHLFDPRLLGFAIVALLAALVIVKRVASGSVLERPEGGLLEWLVNLFNLFFLLVANPVAAVLLIARRLEGLDPTHVEIASLPLLLGLELVGLAIYLGGFALMGGALLALGRSYQLGGAAPRPTDRLVGRGPYALIRHPMYVAALAIAFGLATLLQSWGVAAAFGVYLVLILVLVPREETGLRRAYGDAFARYAGRTKRLAPGLY